MYQTTAVTAERGVIVAATPLRKLSECCTEQCLVELDRLLLRRSGPPSDAIFEPNFAAVSHQRSGECGAVWRRSQPSPLRVPQARRECSGELQLQTRPPQRVLQVDLPVRVPRGRGRMTIDPGVTFAKTGQPLIRVSRQRRRIQSGQYTFSAGRGYRFSLADDGRAIAIAHGVFIIKDHGIRLYLVGEFK